jgi:hypothetical protein
MEKEKIIIELDSALLSWYRMLAEADDMSLNEAIEEALIGDVASSVDNQEIVASVIGARTLINSGIDEFLRRHNCQPSWIAKKDGETETSQQELAETR